MQRLVLMARTLANIRPSQAYHRARRLLLARALALGPVRSPEPLTGRLTPAFALEAAAVPARAEAVAAGAIAFLNRPPAPLASLDWREAPEGELLWLYNVHYFEWGVELAQAYKASGEARYAEAAATWMLDWVARNPAMRTPGWAPYPTARRLPNWLLTLAALQDEPAFAAATPLLFGSIEQQAMHLLALREYDLMANHLLANLQALAWVAEWAPLRPRARRALAGATESYWAEFLRQTHPDGSHEENALSYQMLVARDALETVLLLERLGKPAPEAVSERLRAMFRHLMSLTRPDGAVPMVNDTVPGYPMAPGELLAAAAAHFAEPAWAYAAAGAELGYLRWLLGAEGEAALAELDPVPPAETAFWHRESGYAVFRGGWGPKSDYLLFDAGPLGPRHQMGHAHADMLAIELFAGGKAIVVDPGVYRYPAGEWRSHFRSTAAHNTVAVDGQDQSELWLSFRVARHATAEVTEFDPAGVVGGVCRGFPGIPGGIVHHRRVERLAAGAWRLEDRLESRGGAHRYSWSFQLAPGARAAIVPGEAAVAVEHGQGVTSLFRFEGAEPVAVSLEGGWVSEGWNVKQPAPVIRVALSSAERAVRLATTIAVTTGGA